MKGLATVLFLALTLTACASTGGPATAPSGSVKPYPLDTCLVTGTKLGSMGDPYVKVYGDQEIKFCCEPCVAEFEKDPDRFSKMLPAR